MSNDWKKKVKVNKKHIGYDVVFGVAAPLLRRFICMKATTWWHVELSSATPCNTPATRHLNGISVSWNIVYNGIHFFHVLYHSITPIPLLRRRERETVLHLFLPIPSTSRSENKQQIKTQKQKHFELQFMFVRHLLCIRNISFRKLQTDFVEIENHFRNWVNWSRRHPHQRHRPVTSSIPQLKLVGTEIVYHELGNVCSRVVLIDR